MVSALVTTVTAYVGICVLAWIFQSRLVYFPGPPPTRTPEAHGLDYQDVPLTAADGVRLSAWYLPVEEAEGCVLVCHGNAGNIEHRLFLVRGFQAMGLSVLLFDYRGYGHSQGSPSEEGTVLDARAALEWLRSEGGWDEGRIVLYGESLGGAVALEAARGLPLGAVIVESTFTSLPALGARVYPLLPVRLIATIRYDNLDALAALRAPLLVMHSPQDDIVPFDMGRELFEAAPAPKEFLQTAGRHNDGGFQLRPEWQDRVRDFVRRSLPASAAVGAESGAR
ncbi:MAG TPA: alpha/beta hydrolase [Planctomycetota bacterium]|nr:alpha/beta hydrolase [Planctomycetota bacterium]